MPAIPKPRARMLETADKVLAWQAIDKAESVKVKTRSGGRCEVTQGFQRCPRRGYEVHHHIGGWKLRGRGESALAANKTHACSQCHRLITGNVLEHVSGNRYRRME